MLIQFNRASKMEDYNPNIMQDWFGRYYLGLIFLIPILWLPIRHFTDSIDEDMERQYQAIECVKMAWVSREDSIWTGWLIINDGENHANINESRLTKKAMQKAVDAELKRLLFCDQSSITQN